MTSSKVMRLQIEHEKSFNLRAWAQQDNRGIYLPYLRVWMECTNSLLVMNYIALELYNTIAIKLKENVNHVACVFVE